MPDQKLAALRRAKVGKHGAQVILTQLARSPTGRRERRQRRMRLQFRLHGGILSAQHRVEAGKHEVDLRARQLSDAARSALPERRRR
jgi:hypothetical protein